MGGTFMPIATPRFTMTNEQVLAEENRMTKNEFRKLLADNKWMGSYSGNLKSWIIYPFKSDIELGAVHVEVPQLMSETYLQQIMRDYHILGMIVPVRR